MTRDPKRTSARRRGGAMLELALSMPLLMTLLLGIADLGRLYYFSVTGIGGAYSGATYASMATSNADDTAGITAAVTRDAVDATNLSVTSTKYCQCGSSTKIDCANACGAGSIKRMYISVTAKQNFKTLFGFPTIPGVTNLGTTTVFRVR